MILLAIDPGADQGWALFDDGVLTACGLGMPMLGRVVDAVAIERPHPHRTKARVKDILTLALRAGETGGALRAQYGVTPTYVEPAQWKGTVKKEVSHVRILLKLDLEEREILDRVRVSASKKHNIIDAIGIGLWATKR